MNMKCPSKKVRYPDKISAQLVLARAVKRATEKRGENSVYRCNLCKGGWHLTSRMPRGKGMTGVTPRPSSAPKPPPKPPRSSNKPAQSPSNQRDDD